MIALHLRWGVGSPPPTDRISASLGIGTGGCAAAVIIGNGVFASTTKTQRAAKSWRPVRQADGGYILFNGHIDNRSALRTALSLSEIGDAELYAAALTEWGDAADLRVIGQYCCARINSDGQSVRIVRSPLFAPPLHIWHDHDQIIVASVPRVIFATGAVQMKIDQQKIADSLILNFEEEQRGWFEGVSRLPISSRATIDRSGVRLDRYYDPLDRPEIRFSSDDQYVEAARDLLAEGTRFALQDFSRPAISLSGGLDSQAVAVQAVQALGPERILKAYTSVPEARWQGDDTSPRFADERPYVEALADMYPQISPEWIDAPGLSFGHKLNEMFLLSGLPPLATSNMHWLHEISSRAKSSDCDVLLTAGFGNITFSWSCPWYHLNLFKHGHWHRLLKELHAIRRPGKSWIYEFGARVGLPILPRWAWTLAMKRMRPGLFKPYDSWSPINPEWAKELRVEERAADLGWDIRFRPVADHRAKLAGLGGGDEGDLEQAFEQLYALPRRDPTSYRPFAEFCFAIPDEQYIRNGETRWLARRMLKGLVPEMVRTETRRGRQGADWELRLGSQKQKLSDEVSKLAASSDMTERLDLPSLQSALDQWQPGGSMNETQKTRIELALTRALVTARFIRYVEGSNDN